MFNLAKFRQLGASHNRNPILLHAFDVAAQSIPPRPGTNGRLGQMHCMYLPWREAYPASSSTSQGDTLVRLWHHIRDE